MWDQDKPVDPCDNLPKNHDDCIKEAKKCTILGRMVFGGEERRMPLSESYVMRLSCHGVGSGGA
jgi:hypothetical protein